MERESLLDRLTPLEGLLVLACVKMTEQCYWTNLPPFKAAIEDGHLDLIRDADHLNDICAFKVVHGQPKLPKNKTKSSKKGPKRHGDAGIAYLLSNFASNLPIVEYDYTATTHDRTVKAGFKKRKQGVL